MKYLFTPEQLCLLQLSINVWLRRGAAKICGLSFNEETVTEVLLLELALTFPGSAEIIPFSRNIEACIGADWAWAFVGPGGHCQGMLVQAKRLADHDREYGSLFYTTKSGRNAQKVSQLGVLIASARRYKLPPVLAFYNHLSDTTRVPSRSCGTLDMMNAHFPESWGVAIASAINVKNAHPIKTFDRHRNHSRPLHCLLCSEGTGRRTALGSAGAAASALSDLFEGTSEEDGLGDDLIPPYEATRTMPELFRRAEGIEREREEDVDGAFADLRRDFPALAGVAIFRDSEIRQA